jgi:hypothetical protein
MSSYFTADDIPRLPQQFQGLLTSTPSIYQELEQEIIDKFVRQVRLAAAYQTLLLDDLRDYTFTMVRVLAYDLGNSNYVFLRGYNPDASLADPYLARALKQTILRVLVWRLSQREINPTEMNRTSDGSNMMNTKITYRSDANSLYPRSWDADLLRFSLLNRAGLGSAWAF